MKSATGEKASRYCSLCPSNKRHRFAWTTSTTTIARHLHSKHSSQLLDTEQCSLPSSQAHITASASVLRPVTGELQKAATNLLVCMVADKKLPFTFVESQEFINFCKMLNSTYKVPSRRTLVWQIEPVYQQLRTSFIRTLGKIKGKLFIFLSFQIAMKKRKSRVNI